MTGYRHNSLPMCQHADMPAHDPCWADMPTCQQGTYASQVFHIRLPRPTMSVDTDNHGQIQTWNIQYEYANRVYGKSLLQETSMWVREPTFCNVTYLC